MTNVYIVKGSGAINYTPFFALAGFRFVTVSGLPNSFTPPRNMLTSHFVHTDVRPYGTLKLAPVAAEPRPKRKRRRRRPRRAGLRKPRARPNSTATRSMAPLMLEIAAAVARRDAAPF